MRRKNMTVRDAAEEWVNEFNAIQTDMIDELMQNNPEDWCEITVPSVGDRVYVYDESASGEVVKCSEDKYVVRLDPNGKEVAYGEDDFEIEYETRLPMWGTMWSFGDSADEWWVNESNGIKALSRCGFRIYKSDKYGIFFGIDGAGYSFYEEHWIPLYKERGLQWHDPETEKLAS